MKENIKAALPSISIFVKRQEWQGFNMDSKAGQVPVQFVSYMITEIMSSEVHAKVADLEWARELPLRIP